MERTFIAGRFIIYNMPVKAVISLKKIKYNAEKVKKALPENVKFCAVVKADAYGHGAAKVASALYKIADCFAVATVEEGVELRFCGIDKNILVLTAVTAAEARRAIEYSLTLTACGIADLKRYDKQAVILGVAADVHLKFNTGMNRQGINDIVDLKTAFDYCKTRESLNVSGLYSHFARPENERSRKKAAAKFSLAKKFAKSYNSNIICHISASGGFLKGEYQDMVRIGILLYGYTPFKTDAIKVKPAMKVYAPVVQRRCVRRGDVALYGDRRVRKSAEIALIRYGYADGLFRKEIKGQINNRCMDVTAATGVRKRVYRVAVMDNAEKAAKSYGTISYEILVKCALRAEKVYLK